MHADIERLVADSGKLCAVTGIAGTAAGRFSALFLEFENGTVRLECDDDTDEAVVSVCDEPQGQPVVSHEALIDLEGLMLECAWELRNNRGYTDGFQVRLRDGRGREETRQFEVGASAIDVRRVVA